MGRQPGREAELTHTHTGLEGAPAPAVCGRISSTSGCWRAGASQDRRAGPNGICIPGRKASAPREKEAPWGVLPWGPAPMGDRHAPEVMPTAAAWDEVSAPGWFHRAISADSVLHGASLRCTQPPAKHPKFASSPSCRLLSIFQYARSLHPRRPREPPQTVREPKPASAPPSAPPQAQGRRDPLGGALRHLQRTPPQQGHWGHG